MQASSYDEKYAQDDNDEVQYGAYLRSINLCPYTAALLMIHGGDRTRLKIANDETQSSGLERRIILDFVNPLCRL